MINKLKITGMLGLAAKAGKIVSGANATKEAILKILKEKGYKEIIGIVDIYGDEVDEQDYYDNIKY